MYPLCVKCFKLRDEGKVMQCPDCKAWHKSENNCVCKPVAISVVALDAEKPLSKCIICKKDSNGFLFCKECYKEYKNKELLIRINKCTEIELLDETYDGIYTCKDGHRVKSKSERSIDDYLFENDIPHIYEREVYVKKYDKVLRPDFYLPKKDIYIEHWGFGESNKAYTESKKYKLELYEEQGFTVISTYEKDMQNPEMSLKKKLETYDDGKINFID